MSLLRRPIDELLATIERQRGLVDARLDRPARWRGPLRREGDRRRRRRVRRAFDGLVARARRGDLEPLSAGGLRTLHRIAVGGGQYRTRAAGVGGRTVQTSAAGVPEAVERAVHRAGDGLEPAPLAAARLHLELTLIHPFSDGNGRTARLAASWVLLGAGHRSTLLTAVEQHPRLDPSGYARAFGLIAVGGLDVQGPWLRAALRMMIAASQHAAAHREREAGMRAALTRQGIPEASHDRLLVAHDFEDESVEALAGFDRWSRDVAPRLGSTARAQISRLLAEEAHGRKAQ